MKRRIQLSFLFVTLAAIILTLILATVADHENFKKEILHDLENDAYLLSDSGMFDDPANIKFKNTSDVDVRISLISSDGLVCFDTHADENSMESHKSRPEIKAAINNNKGNAIRHSETLDKNTFYVAVKMNNGYILRVAKETDSLWSSFLGIMPYIICIIIGMSLLTIILTHVLTKSIVKPIEQMTDNMDDMKSVKGYKELQPFIEEIQNYHDNILKNANIRQEFTANVSHELKTPLTAISGYSELIENGMATNEDITRFAKRIHKNSTRLLNLINDIIHLSELDVMDETPQMESIDIFEIAKTASEMLQLKADKHDVLLTASGVNAEITANREMMEELVYNLIDNAIRYNVPNGSVQVLIYREDKKVCLCVKDTGIGIPKEHQERIFERFYRVDKSRSKSSGGTGLGLAIVKHIVSLHKADISMESQSGVGTTVTVVFTP